MPDYGYIPYSPADSTVYWLERVGQVLVQYQENLPLTVRQIFYRLVAHYGFDKTEKDYGNLSRWMRRARRASLLPEDGRGTTPLVPMSAIRDDGWRSEIAYAYADADHFAEVVRQQAEDYRGDRQAGQPRVLEFWCEAAGMLPTLTALAEEYGVRVSSSGGYDSVTTKHVLAQRVVARKQKEGRRTLLLHVGDFDGSGENMFDNMHHDVLAMVYQHTGVTADFEMRRVALTAEQVSEYQVITAPPKGTDSRTPGFLERHWELVDELGTEDISAQLEALTPDQVTGLFRTALEAELDEDAYKRALADEEEIRAALIERADEF